MAATLEMKDFATPDEKRTPSRTTMEIVTVGGQPVARITYAPGWRWSNDIQPTTGADSCQVNHFAVILSGRMHVRMNDGTEQEFGPGNVGIVPAGHDAWVEGDQPCVMIDFQGLIR